MAESAEDRRNQREIADIILRMYPDAFDVYEFFPEKSVLDGCFLKNGKRKIYFEIKHRYTVYRHFPDYIISMGKVDAAREMRDKFKMRTVALIRFADNILVSFDLLKAPHFYRWGGKNDKPEMVAVYQWDDMKILSDPRRAAPIRIAEPAE